MNLVAWYVKTSKLPKLEWIKFYPYDNDVFYLIWYTEIKTSKEIVELFENIKSYDISISTEDKIVIVDNWKEVEDINWFKIDWIYKNLTYDGFSIEEVVEIENDFSWLKIIREVENSKFSWNRMIRVDFLSE